MMAHAHIPYSSLQNQKAMKQLIAVKTNDRLKHVSMKSPAGCKNPYVYTCKYRQI